MKRRHLISLPPALLLAHPAAAALTPTPAQSAGPFYPDRLPLDDDNDLVRVTGQPRPALGTVLHLAGRVRRIDGSTVAGARVEIWQCDARGRYHHPRDRRAVEPDPGFQGYGRTTSAEDGGYRFRTIRPVAYPGRTPHVHFAITAPGDRTLVTQMYVDGEPGNERDFLYTRIPSAARPHVTVALQPHAESPDALSARFDIVMPA